MTAVTLTIAIGLTLRVLLPLGVMLGAGTLVQALGQSAAGGEAVNTPGVFLTVAAGLAVRIGLPLLLLVSMVLVMRRLDARWQAEAKRPAGPTVPPADPPCWEAHQCAPEARVQCAAYQHPETPCWQHFRDQNGNLRQGCLACEFFAAVPVAQPARDAHRV